MLPQLMVAAQLRYFEQKLLHWGIKDSPFHLQAEVNHGEQVIDQDLAIVAVFEGHLAFYTVEDGENAQQKGVVGSPQSLVRLHTKSWSEIASNVRRSTFSV